MKQHRKVTSSKIHAHLQSMTIKFLCSLISLILIRNNSIAQNQSHKIDSMTRSYIQNHRVAGQKKIFTKLLQARNTNDFMQRIDTTQYQYAYVEESYHMQDSTVRITEYYFDVKPPNLYHNNFEDSLIIPDVMYINGQLTDQRYIYYSSTTTGVIFHDKYEYYYTLDTIRARCKTLLPLQSLSYDNTPVITNTITTAGRPRIDTSEMTKKESELRHVKMLRSIFQIVTFIDKSANRVTVSVQHPVADAVIHSYPKLFEYHQW